VVTVDASGEAHALVLGSATVYRRHEGGIDSTRVNVVPVAPPPPPAVELPRTVVSIPAAIDATGASDVSDALIDFFASVPDGATIRFPAGARYRVEKGLLFEGRVGLTFEGNGATVFADDPAPLGENTYLVLNGERVMVNGTWAVTDYARANRTRQHFRFEGGGDITIRDLTIRGAHWDAGADGTYVAELEGQHGISFNGVQGALVERVRITDVLGDFVYFGGHDRNWSRRITVRDSHFERNGRQGMAITAAEDVLFERNYMGDVRRTLIDHEPNGNVGGMRRVTIRNNVFGPFRLTWFAGHGKQGVAEDLTIENNLTHGPMNVIMNDTAQQRHKRWRIVGNRSTVMMGSPIPLMRFHHVDGLVVRDNVQAMNARREMTGVSVSSSCGVDVGGNQFQGSLREYVINSYDGCTP
jgi:hypothetical protein